MQGSGSAKRMRRYNPWTLAILFVYADTHVRRAENIWDWNSLVVNVELRTAGDYYNKHSILGRNTNKGKGEEIYHSARDIQSTLATDDLKVMKGTKRSPENDVCMGIGKHTGAVQVVCLLIAVLERGRKRRKRGGTEVEKGQRLRR
ncbi:hypothetical protein L210DRAFT_3501099 [Boletus edulis BED1]|uniref:Uncharacterized protein n=1 Tax=Boletus edulis BED1 TaxID=1328754 RepID=A0AAD4GJA6_BOLED|nr:hypothetical protein L210DRAFT_3501099 [Boletus edulis BED1]